LWQISFHTHLKVGISICVPVSSSVFSGSGVGASVGVGDANGWQVSLWSISP